MNAEKLTRLEFDLAYLALLTQSGTKPLSRWEKPVPHGVEEVMDDMGLEVAYVRRSLRNRESTTEFIFGKSEAHLDLYLRRFDSSRIDKSIETQRLEGFLFGFPPCCVESFAHFGYRDNGLGREDQKLLFHWACPHCRVTPLLLPSYRQAHEQCTEIYAARHSSHNILTPNQKDIAKKVLAAATSFAFVATGAALYAPTSALAAATLNEDPHWLPLPANTDGDGDFLPDGDEPFLGMLATDSDTDDDGQLDGVQLAKAAHAAYAGLPHEVQGNRPYAVDHMLRGVEKCTTCDSLVNMGYVEIVNPLENLVLEAPYIALHYLQHGSWQYAGDVHGSGSVRARTLKAALESDGTLHRLPIQPDEDSDGLADDSEARLGCETNNPDSDLDGVADGVQLARQYWKEIEDLPRVASAGAYRIEHEAWGLEMCEVCGIEVNMGFTEIINPAENYRVNLPYICLHYLRHGSFAAKGSEHVYEQFDPRSLDCVLHSSGAMHLLPIEDDIDHDALTSSEEGHFGTQPIVADTDHDGTVDGVELGRELVAKVDSLPRVVQGGAPYCLEYQTNGLEQCEVCGETLNMGFVEIVNPATQETLAAPFVGLHVMRHGGFAYDGTVHDGRVDPIKLARLLGMGPTAVDFKRGNAPAGFALWRCFPNPFQASTLIRYDITTPSVVRLEIYNVIGQKIRTLVKGQQFAGMHQIHWDGLGDAGQAVPSGVYLVHLQVGTEMKTNNVAIVR